MTKSMPDLTLHSLLRRNPDLVAADMGGDIVMMSIERGQYFGLSGVAARVWELLDTPSRPIELARRIHAEYEVDEADCQRDMMTFAQNLLSHGVVRVDSN